MAVHHEDQEEDVWAPLRYFLGSWEGTGKGQPGESRSERDYQFILNGKFLRVRGRSVYEPQEKNPEGEVHEELGLISYDSGRGKFILREFHVEGFVNQYVLDSIGQEGKTLRFVTESIENIPAGWQARTTYQILGDDEFRETFDLSAPGKDFDCYIENSLKRKKS